MKFAFSKTQIALAAVAALGVTAMGIAPTVATAAKPAGKYVAGDFHNHSTCSDGSISMQKLVKKSTESGANGFGLDWFVQAGHGGSGNRNCTLTEDASLDTPAYPFVTGTGPTTTWQSTPASAGGAVVPKGLANGASPNANMWRWQSLQEFQYPVIEYLSKYKNVPLFLGVESVVAGHEHSSMSVITGQIPAALDSFTLPTSPVGAANTSRYAALGNASALAQWEYCFDRNDTDTSRGNATVGTTFVTGGNNWNCSVTGSLNAADTSWNATAQKLVPAGGTGTGNRGHLKTVEAVKWTAENHPNGSYYVPAHLERAGPFNPNGNNGFNIEHLRNFHNAAPRVAFGFETQPGHGASANRGEIQVLRNGGFTCTGTLTNPGSTTTTTLPDGSVCTVTVAAAGTATSTGTAVIDSAGGTTFGGTGIYGAQLGGVWDALLGEGRNFWFFASSDWHNRGTFGPDDRRSTQDFYPGEYQRNYTMVRTGTTTPTKLTPQQIVDGLRTGNNWTDSGQLIDRLAFVACASYAGRTAKTNAFVESLATNAAVSNTDIDTAGCATMGEKLKVNPGAEIVVSVVVRDPAGTSTSPYTFANPSLAQIGVSQPLNAPVLHHVDLIRGLVTGYKTPGSADYSGEWPRNANWLRADGTTAGLSAVPNAAKNTSATVIKTFNAGAGSTPASWVAFTATDGSQYLKMTYRIPAVTASQYVRLRGTNLPPAVPFETDASGEPLSDVYTNAGNTTRLRIPCAVVGTTDFDGCPAHMATASGASPIVGQKAVSYDVAAWADLWFYSNPIFVEVVGSSIVAGVN
jgi:hypothetical protein